MLVIFQIHTQASSRTYTDSKPLAIHIVGLDIGGPLATALNNKRFLLFGVDYFTKWVEAGLLARIQEKEVKDIVWKNIIYRFGVSKVLVSNNGKTFEGAKLEELCEQL